MIPLHMVYGVTVFDVRQHNRKPVLFNVNTFFSESRDT